jgi:myo-inositol 2-dehydrogenase / D-chiro-inositol 1-dehydrogenase
LKFNKKSKMLQTAVAGLGRMGKRHALHFAEQTPRAQLVAVSSPDEAEQEWARQRLGPLGVAVYKDYDEMLNHHGLQAVVVASATAVHAKQAIKAIERDLHVLCEKPLSTSVEIVPFLLPIYD